MGEVYRYLREPVDFGNLAEGEMPQPGEIDSYTITFSREQLRQMMDLAKAAEAIRAMDEKEESENVEQG